MNARYFIILPVLLAAALSACTEPEVKRTEDVNRIEQIDRFIGDLRGYAVTKNLEELGRVYPEDRRGEIPEIKNAVGALPDPRLELVIDRIVLDNEKADVTLHWEYRFGRKSETKPTVKRGNAVLHLEGETALRVESISGDNPFSAPLAVRAPPE